MFQTQLPPTGKLRGMNETSATIAMATTGISNQAVAKRVLSVANVGVVATSESHIHRSVKI